MQTERHRFVESSPLPWVLKDTFSNEKMKKDNKILNVESDRL